MKLLFLAKAIYSITVVPLWPPGFQFSDGRSLSTKQGSATTVNLWPPANVPYAISNRTNHGLWSQCAKQGEMCPCFGYVRAVLNDKVYSAPVRVDNDINCTAGAFSDYLWESLNGTTGRCMRRNHKKLIFKNQAGCMQPGEPGFGWPGPGVKEDCSFSGWVYHQYSGQIRYNDNCLTAVRPKNGTMYSPWLVKLMNCTMAVVSSARQAWDLPTNVLNDYGEVPSITYAQPEEIFGGVKAIKAGTVGMIQLRDSADIGDRCLELTPGNVPVFTPALFLEAKVCDDLTVAETDKAQWSILTFVAEVTDESWQRCVDGDCSDCGQDCEILYESLAKEITKPVGHSGRVDGGCGIDFIRDVAIPRTGNESMCICQLSGQENYSWNTLEDYANGDTYHNPTFNYTTFPSLLQRLDHPISGVGPSHELMDACSDDLLENQYYNISGRNETSWGPPA